MKSVVLEKHEFQNRNEPISQTLLAIVFHQDSNEEKELTAFFGQYSLKSKIFSTATLMEQVKSVFMKKHESEYKNLSIITAFGHSWTIRIQCEKYINQFQIEETSKIVRFRLRP